MKKIRSRVSKEKRSKEKIILGFIVGFIMVSSVLGYFGSKTGNAQFRYNGLKFILMNDRMYATKINGVGFRFNFLPQQLQNLTIPDEAVRTLLGKKMVYSTYDPSTRSASSVAEAEYLLDEALLKMRVYAVPAYTINTTTKRPVITCLNATNTTPVIIFEHKNETRLKVFGDCINIEANSRLDFLAIKDKLIYKLLGIL